MSSPTASFGTGGTASADKIASSLETLAKFAVGLDSSLTTVFVAFEGCDDASAREIIAMARRMSGLEFALAVRVLSLLAAMLRIVADSDDAQDGDHE